MINSELHFAQDPLCALQDSSPGPQAIQPTNQNQGLLTRPHPHPHPHPQAICQVSSTMSPNMGSFSYLSPDTQQFSMSSTFGNDMQRLQQLQQLGTAPGGMLPQHTQTPAPQGQQQQQQHSQDFLRTLMTQKLPMPSYDDQLRQRLLTAPAEPLLQAPLMDEARFLMAQGGGMGFSTLNRQPFALPSPHELTLRDDTRRMRGGVIEPFPEKLHRLLTEVEATGRSDVISFIANGKAFAIHKPDKFFKEIVPKYFRQSRLSSFKRQLNLYGFELINTGPARGGYYHEMFIKERPELCRRMRRVAVKVQATTKPTEEGVTEKETSSDYVYHAPSVENITNAGPNGPELFKAHHLMHPSSQEYATPTTTQGDPII